MGELAVSSGDGETSEDDFPDSGSDYSTNNVGKERNWLSRRQKGTSGRVTQLWKAMRRIWHKAEKRNKAQKKKSNEYFRGIPFYSLTVQKLLSAMLRKLGLTQSPGNFGLKQQRWFYSELISHLLQQLMGHLQTPWLSPNLSSVKVSLLTLHPPFPG